MLTTSRFGTNDAAGASPLTTNVVLAAAGMDVLAERLTLNVSFPSNPLNVFAALGWTAFAWMLKIASLGAAAAASPSSIVLVRVEVVTATL